MKTRMRSGLAIAEIMAFLLLLLPTMAFIMMFLMEYWAVMRIDNNLKLMTHLATSKLNGVTDLSVWSVIDSADGVSELKTKLASYCPQGSIPTYSRVDGPASGQIEVIAKYTYDGSYLSNKKLSSQMTTYSYHEQNATITIVCPDN
ncbi:hypothetical protein GJV85_07460 [Sulfurimonas aquatica]|uniref:Uncharacterized protein n=1 Tax=Sulfurimonas aquatica TaxID=2672570 RepID=A0A975B0L9_9BACT|nr:hypothetical protein [Sulfurimonas aquatica]QSZ41950.1 hypothetical protein GJV85_07460 [Sulfurimonas aquatica]